MNVMQMSRRHSWMVWRLALVFALVMSLGSAALPTIDAAQSDSGTSAVVVRPADHAPQGGLVECFPGECASQRMAVLATGDRQWTSFVATGNSRIGFTEH
jgi:hypothetical protein